MFRITGLFLIEIDRNNLKIDRSAAVNLTVYQAWRRNLSSRHTDHNFIAVFNHSEVFDSSANIPTKTLL